ncbi:MAG: protein kinase [Tepidisphaera sp.]
MTSGTRSGRVEEIFLRAIEREPGEWRHILDTECEGDRELRAEVESLLKNHADSDDFMDSKDAPGKGLLTGFEAAAGREEALALPADGMIGRYRVLDRIGAGGMGVVYRAEQDRPKRTVALKVLRTGHTSPRMLRRFEFEAEVLGRLQHPGIAQVYEAGAWTHEGTTRPFIAMELVRGLNISRHCEEKNLGVRERLDLIARVCDAVQHAHQVGVIHRDLKPGNILIAEDGQPKLLDFGVARPLQNDLQLTTSMTGLGALIGTLPYMSPEQVLGDPSKIDTRSDVYAMGVILYELLAGKLPHDVRSRSLPEAARIIRDEQPARLSGIDRQFRGEIETIVSQALEKDPAVRYQRAADLADDIRRYLSGNPIQARNASRWYVVQKTIRKHRGWVASGVAAFMGLGAFAIYANLQAQNEKINRIQVEAALLEASTQRRVADTQRNAAETQRIAAETQRVEADTQRTVAREAAARLETELRVSTIENARLMSRTGDLGIAEKSLWREHLRTPSSLHTRWALWEMYYQHGMVATVQAHPASITATAVAPDGFSCATASTDACIRLWRTADMSPIREIKAHTAGTQIVGMAYSSDGKTLVSAGRDRAIAIHDVATGARINTVLASTPVARMALSPDSTRLAVTTDRGVVSMYDFPSLTELMSIRLPVGTVSVIFSTDGRTLYIGARDGGLYAVTPEGETVFEATLANGHGGQGLGTLGVNPITGVVLSGGRDRMIRATDGATGKPLAGTPTANGAVTGLRVFGDGSTIVSSGWWKLDLHDAVTMQRKKSFTASAIASLELFGDDRYALAGMSTGEARIWELTPGGRIDLPGLEGRVSAGFSRDGKHLFTGDSTGRVRMWSLPTLKHVRSWNGHKGRVMTIVAGPGPGQVVTTGQDDRFLRVWDVSTGERLHEIPRVLSESNASVDITPDGKRFAIVTADGTLTVGETDGWRVTHTMVKQPTGYAYIAARFNQDGSRLMASNRNQSSFLWDMSDLTLPPKTTTNRERQQWSMAFAPDGKHIALSSWGRVIDLLDASTLEPVATLEGHSALVGNVDYCPTDSRILASTSVDGTVRLWDTRERRNLLLLTIGDAAVEGIVTRFSPDGKTLVVTGSYGVCFVLDLEYYDRVIANHARVSASARGEAEIDPAEFAALNQWTNRLLAQPWPRLGKSTDSAASGR